MAGIPYGSYGYWIFPDGKVVPCAEAAHVESACQQLGLDPDEELADDPEGEKNFDIRMQGISEGAIRIIVESEGSGLAVHFEKPTAAAAQATLRVAALFPEAVALLEHEGREISMAKLRAELRDWANVRPSSSYEMGM